MNLVTLTVNFPADLVTFTDEILNGRLHFLCSVKTSEMGKIPFHCKPRYQLKSTSDFYSLGFSYYIKNKEHPPCKFVD